MGRRLSRENRFWQTQAGMTLMEIMVVVTIIGAMVGLGAGAVQTLFDVEIEKAARELSATVGYLYGESARTNDIYRLAFQLDDGTYWAESAPNVPESLRAISRSEDMQVEADRDGKVAIEDSENGGAADGEAGQTAEGFQALDDGLLKPKKFSGVRLKDIYVSHIPEKVEHGAVYLYFFPNGSTEYAIINFTDEDESVFYSVEVNPLSGKSKIRNEYYEPHD